MHDTGAALMPDDAITRPGEKGHWRAPLAMFVLGLVCFVPWLGNAPLGGTEGHRAITAHQIVESGEWMLPRLYGRVYLRKPPLHYWTLALLEKATGVANEWVWRLPSAISGAAMAAWVALMAGRWFGKPAGWVAGGACLALVPLWSQNRSADIDAMNNLATLVAATCILDILWHQGCHRVYVVLGVLAFAASLLLKGPAGLPLVAGAMVGGVGLSRQWRRMLRPGVWVILVGGAAIFAAWAFAAYTKSARIGIPADSSGLDEIAERLGRWDIGQMFRVVTLPVVAWAYALPVSLSLFFVVTRSPVAGAGDEQRRAVVRAILAALVVACVVNILARTDNPRYVYVLLPMLALLAGAVAARWRAGMMNDATQLVLRALLTGSAIAFTGGAIFLAFRLWKQADARPYVAPIAGAAVVAGVFTVAAWVRRRKAAGAWGLVVLIAALGLIFGVVKDQDHRARSAKPASAVLRGTLPAGARVHAGAMIQDQPELFYYAGADASWHAWGDFTPETIPRGNWVVIHRTERNLWAPAEAHLSHVTPLPTREKGSILAWYGSAAATRP